MKQHRLAILLALCMVFYPGFVSASMPFIEAMTGMSMAVGGALFYHTSRRLLRQVENGIPGMAAHQASHPHTPVIIPFQHKVQKVDIAKPMCNIISTGLIGVGIILLAHGLYKLKSQSNKLSQVATN